MGEGAMGLLVRWGLVLLLALAGAAQAQQEPPARVGRIAALAGEVWLFDTASRQWLSAARNRPLTQGERLAVSAGGSAELQVGATVLMLDGDTEIEAARLDDDRLQFALLRGSVALRVHAAELVSELEVVTPEARFLPLRAGMYRIDRRADTSSGTNWRGLLRATTRDVVLTVEPGQRLELGPDAGAASARWSPPVEDAFAAAFKRESELAGATPEFVSPEMTGVAELARHGNWQQHPEFGWAWTPSVVAPQWAPYRFGQWVWMQPWGWTWVDAAPWGFAPFHYGRWHAWGNRWYWAPGPVQPRPVRPRHLGPPPLGLPPPVLPGPQVDPRHDPRHDPRFDPRFDPRRDPRYDPRYDPRGVPGPATMPAPPPPSGWLHRNDGPPGLQGDQWLHRAAPSPARPAPAPRERTSPRPSSPVEPPPPTGPFGGRER